MALAFACDACGKAFVGAPATAEIIAGAVGDSVVAMPAAECGTLPEATGRREICSIECAIALLGRLTAKPDLARATLDAALKLGRVTAVPSTAGKERRRG